MRDAEPGNTAWMPICTRGQFSMTVLSRQQAADEGIAMPPDAVLVALLVPDDARPPFSMGFSSAASLRGFFAEMQPHDVSFRGFSDEDVAELAASGMRLPDEPLH